MRVRAPEYRCLWCGTPLQAAKHRGFCGDDCRKARRLATRNISTVRRRAPETGSVPRRGLDRRRRDQCKEYLRRAGSMPGARALAKKEGFSANASVWIGALGEVLAERAEERKKRDEVRA